MSDKVDLNALTADVVSAYVANNSVSVAELPKLIQNIHKSLSVLTTSAVTPATMIEEKKAPAVPIKKSVTDNLLTCLHCGGGYKSLKRHLSSNHNQTPDEYRAFWSLANDYPMVAPVYAAERSRLAKNLGLGRKPGQKLHNNKF